MPGFQLFPGQASTIASQTDLLFLFLLGVSAVMIVLIWGAIILFVVKYRRRSENELPPQIKGSNRLELAWTLIPLGGFLIMFFWGASIYLQEASPPQNAEQVYVVAKQWMWKFEHSGGQSEIDELHVPLGRPIRLTMTSQDVIHSFFVPDFRIKQDVLPNRDTTTWFQATQVGKYHIFCTQYCGTGHATMTGYVIVMTPSDYQAWLSGGAATPQAPAVNAATQPSAVSGAQLFTQNSCDGCHKADGSGIGPSFVGLYGQPTKLTDGTPVTVDDNFIRTCILTPDQARTAGYPPVMPSFQGTLTDAQVADIIAYIQSLQTQPPLTPIPGGRSGGAQATGTPLGVTTPVAPAAGSPVPSATPAAVALVPTATRAATPMSGATSAATATATLGPTAAAATETVEPTEEPARPSNPGGPGPAVNLTGNPANGAQIFASNCAACHGPQGTKGLPNPGSADGSVPPLNPIDETIKSPDRKTFATNLDLFIEHGSAPEGPKPTIVMPAWGDTHQLTPQQIADVIAYIISLNQ